MLQIFSGSMRSSDSNLALSLWRDEELQRAVKLSSICPCRPELVPVRSTPQNPAFHSPGRTPAPPLPLPEQPVPSNRLRRQCSGKFMHLNFLSALHHVYQLTQRPGAETGPVHLSLSRLSGNSCRALDRPERLRQYIYDSPPRRPECYCPTYKFPSRARPTRRIPPSREVLFPVYFDPKFSSEITLPTPSKKVSIPSRQVTWSYRDRARGFAR